MLTVQCPSCGAAIVFRSGESVFGVCDYCSTAVTRDDVSVESIGKVAILQEYWSPLQVGTQGTFDGVHFIALGRVTLAWPDGSWNEWFLGYNDGRTGWLTEAQGFYGFSFLMTGVRVPVLDAPCIGTVWRYGNEPFVAQDDKTTLVSFIEGELPFRTSIGAESRTVDLLGPGGQFASFSYMQHEPQAFVGRYEEFSKINFTNLRSLAGW